MFDKNSDNNEIEKFTPLNGDRIQEYTDANGNEHLYIEHPSGYKAWLVNGKRHREGGPAIIYRSGSEVWYKNGKKHREDGPAVTRTHSLDKFEWWLDGELYENEDMWKAVVNVRNNVPFEHQQNVIDILDI